MPRLGTRRLAKPSAHDALSEIVGLGGEPNDETHPVSCGALRELHSGWPPGPALTKPRAISHSRTATRTISIRRTAMSRRATTTRRRPFVTFPGTFGFSDGATLVTASFAPGYTLTIEDNDLVRLGPNVSRFLRDVAAAEVPRLPAGREHVPGPSMGQSGRRAHHRSAGDGSQARPWRHSPLARRSPQPGSMLFLGFAGLAWTALRRRSRIAISARRRVARSAKAAREVTRAPWR